MAVHGYTVSKNKEKARNDLEKCDLSGLESFNPEIKKVVKDIIAKPKVTKNVSKKEETDNRVGYCTPRLKCFLFHTSTAYLIWFSTYGTNCIICI